MVNALLTYLARFQEFEDPEQLKRVVGLMHRQVVRSKAEGLYFRVCRILFEAPTPKTMNQADYLWRRSARSHCSVKY